MIAIYARQSIDKKDSISIETQIELCKKEISDINEVQVYFDKGYSGSNINRPEFQRMLSDVKSGLISKVIIYRLDRMSRSVLDFAKLIETFKYYKVDFQSTQEKFDTSTPMGNAMLSITMVFAQLERETIQKRIKDNFYSRMNKGFSMGGYAPYGFIRIPSEIEGKKTKMLSPDENTVEYLIEMYNLYGNMHFSLGEIARYFNESKTLSPQGAKWDSCKISRIIRNPVYVKSDSNIYQYYKSRGCNIVNDISDFCTDNGCYLYGKRDRNARKYTDVTDHYLSLALHQGLVSSDLFLKCQYKLDKNSQIDNSHAGKHTWLTGIAKCKKCGGSLVVKSSYNNQYKYWYCSNKTNRVCNATLPKMKVPKTEALVQDEIFNIIRNNRDIVIQQENENNTEKNQISIQIEILNQQTEKIIQTLLESNDITAKYLNEKLTDIDSKKQKLQALYNELIISNTGRLDAKQIYDTIKDWDTLSTNQRKDIANQFIDKVLVSNTSIEIVWKYNFMTKETKS